MNWVDYMWPSDKGQQANSLSGKNQAALQETRALEGERLEARVEARVLARVEEILKQRGLEQKKSDSSEEQRKRENETPSAGGPSGKKQKK